MQGELCSDDITVEDDVDVGKRTRIIAKRIKLGFGTKIEEDCVIGPCEEFVTGDNCFIGKDSTLIAKGGYEMGDYVTLHNHLFSNGESRVTIGHNVWIGQNCILNADADIRLGNGVGIGTYSSIWTHARHGELLEGCQIFKEAPVVLENDAWIVGCHNVICPGVTLGEKSVVLTGSVVTKDVGPKRTVAGNPAQDITLKLKPYHFLAVTDKWEMMKKFIAEFAQQRGFKQTDTGWSSPEGDIHFFIEMRDILMGKASKPMIAFVQLNPADVRRDGWSVFNLSTKTYTKQRTSLEIDVIRFLLYPKARFVPV